MSVVKLRPHTGEFGGPRVQLRAWGCLARVASLDVVRGRKAQQRLFQDLNAKWKSCLQ